jgi:hypothetical protein
MKKQRRGEAKTDMTQEEKFKKNKMQKGTEKRRRTKKDLRLV